MTPQCRARSLLTVCFVAMAVSLTSPSLAEPLRLNVEVRGKPGAADEALNPERLGRWLRERLEQEGFTVVLGEQAADARLRVTIEEHGIVLRAIGTQEVSDSVEGGDFDVVALELLHKATAALGRVGRRDDPSEPPAEPRPQSEPQVPTKSFETPQEPRRAPTPERPAVPPSERAPKSNVPGRPSVPKSSSSARTFAITWSLQGGLGIEQRGSAYDPVLSVSGTALSTENDVAARARAELVPAGVGSLAVWESRYEVGLFYHLALYHRLALLAGVMGGAYVHYYRYSGADQGSKLGWAASVPAELSVQTGRLRFGVGASVGLTREPPTHLLFGRTLWQRRSASWGLEALVGWAL